MKRSPSLRPHPPRCGIGGLVVAAGLAAARLLSPAGPAAEPAPGVIASPPIRIGLLLPPSETEADAIQRGAELAAEEFARQGNPITLVRRGQPGQWGSDGDEAVLLVHEDGVGGIVAPTLGAAAHQVLQVAGRTRIPVVSLCSDRSVTLSGIPWTVRIAPRTDEEAAALFGALPTKNRPLRVSAFVPEERAGRETLGDLRAAGDQAGVEWLPPVAVSSPPDPSQPIASIQTANPDLILVWLEPGSAARVVKALRAAGYRGRLAGPSRLQAPAFLTGAGPDAEGFLLAGPVASHAPSPMRERFLARCAARRAEDPVSAGESRPGPRGTSVDPTTALAYDAVQLLATVLRRAGNAPAYQQFPLAVSIEGVSGPLVFDSSGNRRTTLRVSEVRGGRLRTLEPTLTTP